MSSKKGFKKLDEFLKDLEWNLEYNLELEYVPGDPFERLEAIPIKWLDTRHTWNNSRATNLERVLSLLPKDSRETRMYTFLSKIPAPSRTISRLSERNIEVIRQQTMYRSMAALREEYERLDQYIEKEEEPIAPVGISKVTKAEKKPKTKAPSLKRLKATPFKIIYDEISPQQGYGAKTKVNIFFPKFA